VKKKPTSPVVDPSALVTSVHGACVMLDCGRDRVYALLQAKELESYRDGEARRVIVASVRAYIARKLADGKNKFERSRYPQKPPPDDNPAPT
jgi:excisionase family DNA binding protein